MNKKLFLTKSINLKSFFFIACFLFLSSSALASHFRYGDISWRVDGNDPTGRTIIFKANTGWTCCPGVFLSFNGTSSGSIGTVPQNLTGNANGAQYYSGEVSYTFPANGTYKVWYSGGAKISNLSNNANGSWYVYTTVTVGNGNNSPVTSLPAVVNVQVSNNNTFNIPVADSDGDSVTYRLATSADGWPGVQPSGFSILSNGQATFDTNGKSIGQLWNAAVVITDSKGADILVDFIMEVTQQSNPPQFNYSTTPADGTAYQSSPGQTITFPIEAFDTDPGSTVNISASGLPVGAIITPNFGIASNPVNHIFSWTPTASQFGQFLINFIAQDNNGVQVSSSVSINISLKPIFDVPPTPAEGIHNIYTPGDVITHSISASDPDPLDVVHFSGVNGKDMMAMPIALYTNASFDNLNGTPANPTTGTFTWNTQASDWGHKHVYFFATDSYGDTTRHEISQLINTPPVFSSLPITTADVGVQYSYTVQVTDPDITYGDELSIAGISLPSWLTLTDNGNGTATLSGNPTVADVGTASINILAEDKNHHQDPRGIINQNFDITVNNCTISAITNNITVQLNTNGEATINTSQIDNGSTASCGIASITIDKTSFDCANIGENTVTLTVTDNNDNVSTETTIVTIEDGTAQTTFNQTDYINIGNSSYLGNTEYRLTNALNGQFGAVWYQNKLNLSTDFELDFDIYLGTQDYGADGTAFVLQPLSTNQGSSGGGLGYLGINPSLAVEFDTYTNTSDPYQDHIALTQNGDVVHTSNNNLSGPHIVSNLENGAYHNVKIKWVKATNNFTVVFQGSTIINYTGDIVNDIFSGNSGVFWGFTASTGGLNNEHRVKINTVEFEEELSISVQNITAATCPDSLDGSIDINVSPASPCTTYSWSNGETSQDISNLNPGDYTVTVTKVDGTITTKTFTVTGDIIDPVFSTIETAFILLDENGTATYDTNNFNEATVTDNCGIDHLDFDKTTFNCNEVGIQTINVTAFDTSGNSSVGTIELEVRDGISPTVITKDITVELGENGNISINQEMINNGSSDNCGIASYSLDITDFNCENIGENTVILTVTDNNDNVSKQTATVTVQDNIVPTAIAQNINIQLDVLGNASVVPSDVDNGSNDACGVSLALDKTSFTCANVGDNTVTLIVTDNNNNVSSTTATVTVSDNIAPIAIAQDITIQLDANGEAVIVPLDVDNGSNDACPITLSLDITSFNCSNVGLQNTVALTARDASGNTNTTTANVTVVDSVVPNVITQNIDAFLNTDGNTSIVPSDINNGSNDACGIQSIVLDITSFDCANLGKNTVLLTVTDVNGNVNSKEAIVTVIDNIAPIVGTQNISVELDANGNATITPEDVLILTENDVVRGDSCTVTNAEAHAMCLEDYSHYKYNDKNKKESKNNCNSGNHGHNNDDACFSFDANQGSIIKNIDGSMVVTGTLVNPNDANDIWKVTLNLQNPKDWTEWSSLNRKYNGTRRTVGNNYKDWTYFEMATGSKLTGAGTNLGNETLLIQKYEQYGFQLGDKANLENGNYGLSGSFYYTNKKGKKEKGTFNFDISNCEQLPVPEETVFSSDNCSIESSVLDITSFSCGDLGENTVQVSVTDQSGNTTTQSVIVNVLGETPIVSIKDFYAVSNQKVNTVFLGYTDSVYFKTEVSGGAGFIYEWFDENGTVISTDKTPKISPEITSTYTLVVTNSNGCQATDSIEICVIDARAKDRHGRFDDKIIICHHSNSKSKHNNNDKLISVSKNAVYAHVKHGDILGGCEAICATEIYVEPELVTMVNIYPNPSTGYFKVKLDNFNNKAEILLFDLYGRLIQYKIVKDCKRQNSVTMGKNRLREGVYVVKIRSEGEIYTGRVVIERGRH